MIDDKVSDTGFPVSGNTPQNWITQIYVDGVPIKLNTVTGLDTGLGDGISAISVFDYTGFRFSFTSTQKLSRKKHQQLLKYFGVGYKKCRVPRKLKKQNKKKGITL